MNKFKKIAALIAAGVLVFSVAPASTYASVSSEEIGSLHVDNLLPEGGRPTPPPPPPPPWMYPGPWPMNLELNN